MKKEQEIDIFFMRTKIKMVTDQPGEMYALADEVNKEIAEIADQYPGAKQNELFIFACIKILQTKKELQEKYDSFEKERENINNAIDSVFSDIE